ncbi:MAG: cytochrome C [Desulfobacterales bacterium]|nr:cytochrome C [Desulfobacterales bacterium]MCP4159629.1 cytochrome C [Deltaproteobacteria bacterium]
MLYRFIIILVFLNLILFENALSEKAYVGSQKCQSCHETEYSNYKKYSQKAKSYKSVEKMKSKLKLSEYQGCLKCHTTGYGKGGFISIEKTPHLKDAGCESCHGPGSTHIESEDPDDIKGKLDVKDCMDCHNKERVEGFKFKPMIYGGAH